MQKIIGIIVSILVLASCENAKRDAIQSTESEEKATSEEVVAVSVADFMGNPAQFAGKEITLKGTVVHVCKHGGKRLHMIGEDVEKQLKVESGENQNFERELEGSDVLIRGIVLEEKVDAAHIEKRMEEVDGHADDPEHQAEQKENMQKMKKKIEQSGEGFLTRYTIQCKNYQVL